MTRSTVEFLQDIVDWMENALSFVEGVDRQDFASDLKTRAVAERAIEIIGEASKNVPDDVRSRFPDVPWQQMTGMRDRVAHAYFGVDYDILWDTVTEAIPALLPEMQRVIQTMLGEQTGECRPRSTRD